MTTANASALTAKPAPTPQSGPTPKTSPRCGAGFGCTVDAHCWCMDEPYRMPMPKPGESPYEGCLCTACLRDVAEASGLTRRI